MVVVVVVVVVVMLVMLMVIMLVKYAGVPPGEQTPGDWLELSLVLAGSVECCKTLSLLNILPGSCRERERERERDSSALQW